MRFSKRDLSSTVIIRDLYKLYDAYSKSGQKDLMSFKAICGNKMLGLSGSEARIVKINFEGDDPDGYYKYRYRLNIDKKEYIWYEWMFVQDDGDDYCPVSITPLVKDKQYMFDFIRN